MTASRLAGADHRYAYVNPLARVQAAGRIPVSGHAGEFGIEADRTQPGGPISGHLEFEDQADGVHLHDAVFTDLFLTSTATAQAQGTASCSISGATSPCAFTLTVVDGGKNSGSFTLTYNTTTVGGTILSGHVTVTAEPSGGSTPARATAIRAAATPATRAVTVAAAGGTPVAAAMTGPLSASLLGVSLSGGECGTGALVAVGTASGEVSCLLLGAAGINIAVDLPVASGIAGTGAAALSGTATVTVGTQQPLSLPVTAALTPTGLRLTIAGITLPVLPAGTGGTEIG